MFKTPRHLLILDPHYCHKSANKHNYLQDAVLTFVTRSYVILFIIAKWWNNKRVFLNDYHKNMLLTIITEEQQHMLIWTGSISPPTCPLKVCFQFGSSGAQRDMLSFAQCRTIDQSCLILHAAFASYSRGCITLFKRGFVSMERQPVENEREFGRRYVLSPL